MSIQYTYEIVKVDEAARCMEVVYSATGHQTMHIGARLPFVGESLKAVIEMFAPVAYWEQQAMPVMLPEIGATGTVKPLQMPEAIGPAGVTTFEVAEVLV
jgi:hypothetical protein